MSDGPLAGRRRGAFGEKGSEPPVVAPVVPPAADAEGPPKPKRTGGWGDEAPKDSKKTAYDKGETVMVIPDITEENSDDITTRVAEAPAAAFPKLPGIRDLDAGVKFRLPPPHDADTDLSVLVQALAPHSQMNEGRARWTFESLLQEVMAELLPEEKDGEGAEKASALPGAAM